MRLLALGDSYTIGEGVESRERWPVQLVQALRERGTTIDDPIIVAHTGWTAGELLAGVEQAGVSGTFDLVSLMVGVNNQFRGLDVEGYRHELRALLELSIGYAGGDPSRVIVLSIPDWGVTPYAQGRDGAVIAAEIEWFNLVSRDEALRSGANYVDVTPLSRQAVSDPAMLAEDGLHPSGEMYAVWVAQIFPTVLQILEAIVDRWDTRQDSNGLDVANGYTEQDE